MKESFRAEIENEKRERRTQRGLWKRRHRLNVVERELLVNLNKKYGTYTGPKIKSKEADQ